MKQELIWFKLCLGVDSYPHSVDVTVINDEDDVEEEEEEEESLDQENEHDCDEVEINKLTKQNGKNNIIQSNQKHELDREDLNSQKAFLLREFGLSDYVPTTSISNPTTSMTTTLIDPTSTSLSTSNSNHNSSSVPQNIPNNSNSQNVEQIESIEYPIEVTPTISLMLQFDQVLTQRLIGYHLKWIEKRISYLQSLYKRR